MNDLEVLDKSKVFDLNDIIGYESGSIRIKIVMKKNTGNVTIASFDSGETMTEKTSPFDHFVQVISGTAEIMIRDQSFTLEGGQCIILPAHLRNTIKAINKLKMLSTVIKSGYEEVS